MSKLPISFEDVLAAAKRIKDGIYHTPAEFSEVLSEAVGSEIFLKFEIFQHTASFKERGALNMLLSLSGAEKKHGVVAASAGNHAQGVAFHAARLGIPATIVMPTDTAFTKIKRSELFGAKIVLHGKTFSEAMAEARRLEKQKNFTFIPTYDHPLIMAGQGTVAVEFLKRFPDLDTLIVPVGGGGLIAGCVVAAGFDPLWFGIFLVITVEMAQVTPPVGFNLFVVQNLTGEPIAMIARAAFPFFLIMAAFALLIAVFPGIVTFLPNIL